MVCMCVGEGALIRSMQYNWLVVVKSQKQMKQIEQTSILTNIWSIYQNRQCIHRGGIVAWDIHMNGKMRFNDIQQQQQSM